ncbi:MAG: geranyl transferase [Cellvibrionales bacterium TMED47]|jgi:geranylgeranyl diphosphate synthase type II|nr:geranyl transferase [Porticoccaceae bacterium]RPG82291.1 MAG: geranyl transferase [Cellvibrionales bacterium TMED47]|tara:strand:- start:3409 stop:4299 length:891 start_codon:yes stop_codon:yes gene_type:complete
MTAEFDQRIQSYTQQVDAQLELIIPPDTGPASKLYQAMRYSVFNGGKRVRPALCFAAAEAISASDDNTVKIAAAVEMIHAYSLIHDDLPAMDDDDLRRGVPTCHIQFDEATAILAGDGLHSLAFKQLTNLTGITASINLEIIAILSDLAGCNGMVTGQAVDLESTETQLSVEELNYMHTHKTGALIEASVVMGAMATNQADEAQVNALRSYARAIGLAFQIQDDILDVESSTEQLGKSQGSDSHNNKATYTSILGIEKAKSEAERLYQESLEALSPFDDKAEPLRALAKFIVHRSF